MRPTDWSVSDWNKAGPYVRDKIEREQLWFHAQPGRSLDYLAGRIEISLIRLDMLLRTDPEFLWGICARIGIDPVLEAHRLGVDLIKEEDLI